MAVIGMGKLGGAELNFSSDVDLVFVYPEDGFTAGGTETIDNHTFFIQLARRLLRMIDSPTADGIVFRVDMRLRPYGQSGPLAMSIDAMEAYYQSQGREWERYAWIKARVVAGDRLTGERLLQRMRPFIYRRYLDYGAFESLRSMKQQIALETQRQGIADNIKLGAGGIREIEFFGQVFQLIRGGVDPTLQRRRILDVLKTLARERYISEETAVDLESAYGFLRCAEHCLQEFSDQQTHALPKDEADRARLAAAMGFEDWLSFNAALRVHMDCVHDHFERLLAPSGSDLPDARRETELGGIWQGAVETKRSLEKLAGIGFDFPDKTLALLECLRDDPATRALSRDGRERLDRLMPLVLAAVGSSERAFLNLSRIVDLIKTIQQRTCYLALMTENPSVLTHLVRLADASPWIVSFLSRHPVLLDELLDPRTLYYPPAKADLEKALRKRLAQIASDDLESQIEALCIFKQINTLRVAAADITAAVPLMRVSDHLTEIAETVLAEVVQLSWRYLVDRHGLPACRLGQQVCESGFAVIAYGKLGGIELGYGSDLDLVFLHCGTGDNTRGARRPIGTGSFFARLGQRVVHLLTTHTSAGFLYETDMRLRPSGSAGLLVSHVDAFEAYQSEKAWTWEHQALIRARVVYGDVRLAAYFKRIREAVLARSRDAETLRREVGDMRVRLRAEHLKSRHGGFDLKQGPGGIVDIEFLVQFLVLLNADREPRLLAWTDNVRLLETLAESGILAEKTATALKTAYLTYRAAVHRLSLQQQPAVVPEGEYRDRRKTVTEAWNMFFGK